MRTVLRMESNNENKQDVMVSNLPLLFSDGNPTNIDHMSAEDLQYFVSFLMKCILGVEPANWSKFPKFKWWPLDIPWSSIILSRKHQNAKWREKLENLVRRCYDYNGCTYLLNFSAKLQKLVGGFKFTDNWDGTTSMYDISSGKLLVTFRDENMNYDKGFRQQSSTQRPTLLPRLNSNSPTKLNTASINPPQEAPSTAKMVEPPVCDIFLCDRCGADFNTLRAIKNHENKCIAAKVSATQATASFIEVETKDLNQAKFLWYLHLSGNHATLPPSNVTPTKIRPPPAKKTYTLSDRRYTTIPFSSNLGQSFFKMSKLSSSAAEALVSRYERLCQVKPRPANVPLGRIASPAPSQPEGNVNHVKPAWSVSNRRASNQKRPKKECWTHSYSFSVYDRKERMKTINTGLNERARQLLDQCVDVRVVVEPLKPDEIEWWRRPKDFNHAQSPRLHPFVQQSIASLPSTCNVSLAPVDSSSVQPFVLTGRDGVSNQKNSSQDRARSPPGLLPLITSAWSLQTMESVQPNNRSQFQLPDLIPVHQHVRPRASNPVVIRMPSTSPPLRPMSTLQKTVEVNLCSSEDEIEVEERTSTPMMDSLSLPVGTSVTKIRRQKEASKLLSLGNSAQIEPNNNRARSVSRWVPSTGTLTTPSEASYSSRLVKPEQNSSITMTPIVSSVDGSFPIVTPLKLGRLPAAKLKQMRQSWLKIQKAEAKSPPSSVAEMNVNKDLTKLLADECKELRHQGLEDLLCSNQRVTRRKRDEDNRSRTRSGKVRKMEDFQLPFPARFQQSLEYGKDEDEKDNDISVIEVDVAGPDTSLEERVEDSSRASSDESLQSAGRRRRTELFHLLRDECKELRDKGLENLTHSGQRVTRRSLPAFKSEAL